MKEDKVKGSYNPEVEFLKPFKHEDSLKLVTIILKYESLSSIIMQKWPYVI